MIFHSSSRFTKKIMSQLRFVQSALILSSIFIWNSTAEKHLKLPSYVVPCSKSASDFDECCRQHGQDIISIISKGDKEYDLPTLDPLMVSSIELDTDGFRLAFKDLKVYGLGNVELRKLKFDLNKNEFSVNTHNNKVSLIGKYECDGNVMVLQIQGKGNINVTITGLEVQYRVHYNIEEKGGDSYIVFTEDADLDYTVTGAYFDLDNLFGGDTQLADATLKVLNSEWDKFNEVLRPVIAETLLKLIQTMAGGITTNVPLKYIFLD